MSALQRSGKKGERLKKRLEKRGNTSMPVVSCYFALPFGYNTKHHDERKSKCKVTTKLLFFRSCPYSPLLVLLFQYFLLCTIFSFLLGSDSFFPQSYRFVAINQSQAVTRSIVSNFEVTAQHHGQWKANATPPTPTKFFPNVNNNASNRIAIDYVLEAH